MTLLATGRMRFGIWRCGSRRPPRRRRMCGPIGRSAGGAKKGVESPAMLTEAEREAMYQTAVEQWKALGLVNAGGYQRLGITPEGMLHIEPFRMSNQIIWTLEDMDTPKE